MLIKLEFKKMSLFEILLQNLYPPHLQIPEFLNRHTEKISQISLLTLYVVKEINPEGHP